MAIDQSDKSNRTEGSCIACRMMQGPNKAKQLFEQHICQECKDEWEKSIQDMFESIVRILYETKAQWSKEDREEREAIKKEQKAIREAKEELKSLRTKHEH